MREIKSLVDRMLERYVEKTPTCWNWTGSVDPKGHIFTQMGGSHRAPHNVFYEHYIGALPADRNVRVFRTCENKFCVNPAHLALRGYQTHCPKGHQLAGANLYVRPDGGHGCKTCIAVWSAVAEAKRNRRAKST